MPRKIYLGSEEMREGGIIIFFIIFNIHSYNTITHSFIPSPLAETRLLVFSSLLRSAREASMGCRDENLTRVCRTVNRRTTNWARPHPDEPRRTLVSQDAPWGRYAGASCFCPFYCLILSGFTSLLTNEEARSMPLLWWGAGLIGIWPDCQYPGLSMHVASPPPHTHTQATTYRQYFVIMLGNTWMWCFDSCTQLIFEM